MGRIIKLKGKNLNDLLIRPSEPVYPLTVPEAVIFTDATGKNSTLKDQLEKVSPTPESETGTSVDFDSTNKVPAGKTLKYGELTALSFQAGSIEESPYETTIYFSSGTTKTTLTLPSGTKVIGEVEVEASTDYIIVIKNGEFIMAPITTLNSNLTA